MAQTSEGEVLVGIESIDFRHRELRLLTEDLLLAIGTGGLEGALLKVLFCLYAHVFEHFQVEEGLMRLAGYPGREAHAVAHAELSAKVRVLISHFARSGTTAALADATSKVVLEWLASHVGGMDYSLGCYLAKDAA